MIWLIGKNGMLGQQLAEVLTENNLRFVGTDLEVDITNYQNLVDFADDQPFDWIINCSSYTAVDKAETEQDKAFAINSSGVGNIAKFAKEHNIKLIHFSTDYVFSGDKDGIYSETDPAGPKSVYGRSKLEGEKQIIRQCTNYFIFRISWLYGIHGPNFVKTMLRLFKDKDELNVIDDQVGSPTYTKSLAENIAMLIRNNDDNFGVYLYSDEGYISWYDFAVTIKEMALKHQLEIKDVKLNPIPTEQYPLPAPRPANSRFSKQKVEEFLDFKIHDWNNNLADFFSNLANEQ